MRVYRLFSFFPGTAKSVFFYLLRVGRRGVSCKRLDRLGFSFLAG